MITRDNYRRGYLEDYEVEDWLSQKGPFAPPHAQSFGDASATIRILICERLGWKPLGFAMSKDSFLAVEKAFSLPAESLPTLANDEGVHTFHLEVTKDSNSVESMRQY